MSRTTKPSRIQRIALLSGSLVALSACPSWFPDTVAEGVSRLAVRDVGAMIFFIGQDATCGFESPDVLQSPTIDGDVGSHGSVTWHVEGCRFHGAAETGTVVYTDCNGVSTTAFGDATITADKTITGTLTGDPRNPVIPDSPDALTFDITSARVNGFTAVQSNSKDKLGLMSGTVSAVVKPRLASAADTGVCSVPTLNTVFDHVVLDKVHVRVAGSNRFETDVATSDIHAVYGKSVDAENSISGTINVYDASRDAAGDGVLDPEYTASSFVASNACLAGMQDPESYVCVDLTPALADGVARLTVRTLGTLAGLLDADTRCGLSSPSVLAAAVVSGAPGGPGTLTLRATDCAFAFAGPTPLPADCKGDSAVLDGAFTITGQKTIAGIVTGDPTAPIVPVTNLPATISLEVTPAGAGGYGVGVTSGPEALHVDAGTLSGSVTPKTFADAAHGFCSVASPNADFNDVTWTSADLLLTTSLGSFRVPVDGAVMTAVNGTTIAGKNELTGSVTIGGSDLAVPSDGAGLDPSFDAATFSDSWDCNPALATPLSDVCATP